METKFWKGMFFGAALFNFAMGGPIFFASQWSYKLAFNPPIVGDNSMTLKFWGDFGFSVLLIGFGYFLISLEPSKNLNIIWLGIFAKLFDVVTLTHRFVIGTANPLVLFPAIADGVFALLFILYLFRLNAQNAQAIKLDLGQ